MGKPSLACTIALEPPSTVIASVFTTDVAPELELELELELESELEPPPPPHAQSAPTAAASNATDMTRTGIRTPVRAS
jgi:hypothetical protein